MAFQVIAYDGGTVQADEGLLRWLFGLEEPTWGANDSGETASGRRRYRYGTRQKSNAIAGTQVLLDTSDGGTYSVRVTGSIVDFITAMLSRTESRVVRAHTRRGTVYAPAFAPLT